MNTFRNHCLALFLVLLAGACAGSPAHTVPVVNSDLLKNANADVAEDPTRFAPVLAPTPTLNFLATVRNTSDDRHTVNDKFADRRVAGDPCVLFVVYQFHANNGRLYVNYAGMRPDELHELRLVDGGQHTVTAFSPAEVFDLRRQIDSVADYVVFAVTTTTANDGGAKKRLWKAKIEHIQACLGS